MQHGNVSRVLACVRDRDTHTRDAPAAARAPWRQPKYGPQEREQGAKGLSRDASADQGLKKNEKN